jgi:membrane fusion protein (multidrug efflux system)
VGTPTFQLILANGSLYPYPGTFRTIERSVDTTSGTIAIQALFRNPSGYLRPGLYGQVRAKIGERTDAVLIPQTAIQQTQSVKTVLVVGSDNLVAVRTIEDGGPFGPFEVSLGGVQAGEHVIVEGLQRVQPGARVTVTVRPAPPVPAAPGTP